MGPLRRSSHSDGARTHRVGHRRLPRTPQFRRWPRPGTGFRGRFFPVVRIDSLTVSATVVHRFIEGALLLVPAFAARWSLRASFALLFVPLASIPAAFVPGGAFDAMGLAGGSATLALSTVLGATEASVALMIRARGVL